MLDVCAVLGRDKRAVHRQLPKLVEAGRAERVGRGWEFELDGIREWWMANVEPRKNAPVGGPDMGRAIERQAKRAAERAAAAGQLRDISESRQVREHYEAELARMKAQQQEGVLVEREAVDRKLFELNRRTRDLLLGLPAQLGADMAATTDPVEASIALEQAINRCLSEIADEHDEPE